MLTPRGNQSFSFLVGTLFTFAAAAALPAPVTLSLVDLIEDSGESVLDIRMIETDSEEVLSTAKPGTLSEEDLETIERVEIVRTLKRSGRDEAWKTVEREVSFLKNGKPLENAPLLSKFSMRGRTAMEKLMKQGLRSSSDQEVIEIEEEVVVHLSDLTGVPRRIEEIEIEVSTDEPRSASRRTKPQALPIPESDGYRNSWFAGAS